MDGSDEMLEFASALLRISFEMKRCDERASEQIWNRHTSVGERCRPVSLPQKVKYNCRILEEARELMVKVYLARPANAGQRRRMQGEHSGSGERNSNVPSRGGQRSLQAVDIVRMGEGIHIDGLPLRAKTQRVLVRPLDEEHARSGLPGGSLDQCVPELNALGYRQARCLAHRDLISELNLVSRGTQ